MTKLQLNLFGLYIRITQSMAMLLCVLVVISSCSHFDNDPRKQKPLPNADSLAANTEALNFFILSDWGFNGSGYQKEVAAAMGTMAAKFNPRFILTCGDNFQYSGVQSATDTLWKINYENVYTHLSLQIPWYPALGNHDYYGNPDAQVEYTLESKYWRMPARYYTFVKPVNNHTAARFIVLDTQDLITKYNEQDAETNPDNIAQFHWLKGVLAGTHEKWLIITGHHPVFSSSPVHGDSQELKALIKPLFEQYKPDFYIAGHDHDFEHAREAGSGIDYIVTGTGGYPRPEGSNNNTVFSMSQAGFSYISLSAGSANLYFITSGLKVGYSYTKTK